ncbi:MAG: TIGR01777 family oxidoreductase [Candidatus Pacebacteria bacterium]|nr:TIGR01777 family oxidoreductase [Candidatus Paceibacterota bacterium]MCD8563675.1 TIGR01777 family oxidoreductase [Candidatus Paceibacterota bacterium]
MHRKKIVITGGSGFLGSYLVPLLLRQGYDVVILDQVPPRYPYKKDTRISFVKARLTESVPHDERLLDPYGYIHLVGKNIFGRFTPEHKKEIYDSRIIGTHNLINHLKDPRYTPRVFIGASAVGIYGDQGDTLLSEVSDYGNTFLSQVVRDWEQETLRARLYGMRTVIFRQGHILGKGGFLGALQPLFMYGLGGPLGSGNQWLPWISAHDLAHLYAEALSRHDIEGIYTTVTPTPIRYKEFSRAFARALHRPHILPTPTWLLALRFGKEFAREMTVSQRIVSHRLPQFDYRLQDTRIDVFLEKQVAEMDL